HSNQAYFALKALNGPWTQFAAKWVSWELPALQLTSSTRGHDLTPHCLRFFDHFSFPCGETPLPSHRFWAETSLGMLGVAIYYAIFLPLAKHILLHTLRALNDFHECGIVHTGIRSDTIFFDTTMSSEDICMLLESDSFRQHQAEASYDGIVHAAVSQPLPLPTIEEFAKRTFVLGDLGS
ncbi:hypothetical protein F5146DRAFT_900412, partial [Armillaria mellea]